MLPSTSVNILPTLFCLPHCSPFPVFQYSFKLEARVSYSYAHNFPKASKLREVEEVQPFQ